MKGRSIANGFFGFLVDSVGVPSKHRLSQDTYELGLLYLGKYLGFGYLLLAYLSMCGAVFSCYVSGRGPIKSRWLQAAGFNRIGLGGRLGIALVLLLIAVIFAFQGIVALTDVTL